jgi:hypothetical protein
MIMKKKLNKKVAKLLVKDLDARALEAVTGGDPLPPPGSPGTCYTCGWVFTTAT